jgi:hypothetical protein
MTNWDGFGMKSGEDVMLRPGVVSMWLDLMRRVIIERHCSSTAISDRMSSSVTWRLNTRA